MRTIALCIVFIFSLLCNTVSAQTVNLGSKVWWDFNDNGIKEATEWAGQWIGVTLYLDNNEDGIADAGFTPINGTTDGNGDFLFTNLNPGKYFVKVDAGWSHYKSTTYGGDPDNNIIGDNNAHSQNTTDFKIKTETITLQPGTEPDGTGATNTNTNRTIGIGMWKANGLGDLVWADNNGNGMQEAGEPGLPNVTVKLKNTSGIVLETTTTDAQGKYHFYDPMGFYGTNDYELEFVTPMGYIATPSNTCDDNMDSDMINGKISSMNVPMGSWDHSFDAGFKPATLLPLNLLSFTATLKNEKAELKWITTNEVNVSHIIVEKSIDGVNFTDIAMLLCNNNGNDKNYYQFLDNINTKIDGIYYYRLRTVNNNGTNTLSEVKNIVISKANSTLGLNTYPNPVINNLNMMLPLAWQNKNVTLSIYSASGALVKQQNILNTNKVFTMPINYLPVGTYIVTAKADGKILTQKLIKH